MGATVISQYLHRPNTTELGLGNTHETYLLVGKDFDLSSIFTPGVEVNVIDSRSGKSYALKSASGSEFRINQMGPIYKDYQVAPGDEIIFTAIKRGKATHIFFTVNKFERVIFYVDKKGVEINNIERLEDFTTGEREFLVSFVDRGKTITAEIKFKEAKKKRADSPNDTDFYTVSLNGAPINAGTYYLTLGESCSLSSLPKATFNSIEVNDDDYNSKNAEILSGVSQSGNQVQHNPNDALNHIIIDIIDDDITCNTIEDLKIILNGSSDILTKFSTKGASNADSANFALLKYYKLFKKLGINTKKDAENLLIETNLYPQSGSGSGVSPLLNILNYLEQNDFFGVSYYETKDLQTSTSGVNNVTHKLQQTIYFGSPGTGKSYGIKKLLRENDIVEEPESKRKNCNRLFRTTFHPDTDYASFVGCYKPVCDNSVIKLLEFDELCLEAQSTKQEIDNNSGNKVEILCQFADKYAESLLYLENKGTAWTALLDNLFGEKYVNSQTYIHSFCKIIASMRENTESKIQYKFVPQVFTEAYVKAWEVLEKNEQVFLVIEEINRGNCAQIFGDLFQLLDRKEDGYSEYKVKADIDLAKHLKDILGENHPGIAGGNLCLPPNLNILATMNTSDQSLFPMDSAFKRRWDWKYIPTKIVPGTSSETTKPEVETIVRIKDKDSNKDNILINYDFKNRVIDFGQHDYKWSDFLKAINERIKQVTYSDDKLLGYWYVKGDKDGNISISTFVSKVIFYLWNDVFKEYGAKPLNPFCVKNKENKPAVMSFNQFFDEMNGEENIGVVHTFMGNLGLIPDVNKDVQAYQDNQQLTEGAPEIVEEEN